MKNKPGWLLNTKHDREEYRQWCRAGEQIEQNLRLGVLMITIFGILWPERRGVDLRCGIKE